MKDKDCEYCKTRDRFGVFTSFEANVGESKTVCSFHTLIKMFDKSEDAYHFILCNDLVNCFVKKWY